MVPSDEWPSKRIDDLATEVRLVASLVPLVAKHDAKIDGLDDLHREFVKESRKTLEEISRVCESRIQRVEAKVDELTRAQRWTPAQWSAILGPTLVALIGAVALVLTGGAP